MATEDQLISVPTTTTEHPFQFH